MVRVTIHSRTGNRVLAIAGTFYVIAGIALFAWYVLETWGGTSGIDRMLLLLLAVSIALGVWFIFIARDNLTAGDVSSSPHAPQRRTSAEVTP